MSHRAGDGRMMMQLVVSLMLKENDRGGEKIC